MEVLRFAALVGLALVASALPASARAAQDPPRPSTPKPSAAAPSPPSPQSGEAAGAEPFSVSLERIRRGLERQPVLELTGSDRPTFQVYIEGRLPTFAEFYAGESFDGGPVGWTSPTHQEFLDLVTPKDAQPFGAFDGKELAAVAAQSFVSGLAMNWLFKALPAALRNSGRRQLEEEARREVQEVLKELARRKAEAEAEAAAPQKRDPEQ